jgi:hypothetical protein
MLRRAAIYSADQQHCSIRLVQADISHPDIAALRLVRRLPGRPVSRSQTL